MQFWQKQDNVFSDHHPGTGQWFLESDQFQNWLDSNPTNLWCHGAPGSGKTVIASIAVHHLRQRFSKHPRVGIAAIYCEWKERGSLSAVNLLASIWDQISLDNPLAENTEEIRAIEASYNYHTKHGTTVGSQEIFSILNRKVECLSSVYVVIDALDELSEDDSRSSPFIEALSKLAESTLTKVHILATSRLAQPLLNDTSIFRINASPDDIKLFAYHAISQGLSSSHHLSDHIRNTRELQEIIIKTISANASGL